MPKLLFSERNHSELTYSDAFLVPNNPIVDRLLDSAQQEEIDHLMQLHEDSVLARKQSRAYIKANRGKPSPQLQLTALQKHTFFRDFVLELAAKYPEIARQVSRDEVDFSPEDGFGKTPIVVANMNNVAGKRMAEATAMVGATTAIPQDKDDDEMRDVAHYLHSREVQYMTPIIVGPDTKVHELKKFLNKRDIDTAIVTEDGKENGKFIGLVRIQEHASEAPGIGIIPMGLGEDKPIGPFIRTEGIITGNEDIDNEEAIRMMEKERVRILPILSEQGNVKGAFTDVMAAMRWRYKPHIDEEHGGLAMLATVGALNKNPIDRVKFLIDMGVKGIVFDTAHFDQGVDTYKNVREAANIISQSRQKILLVAGNVVTAEAALNMFASGADVAKVGIGPGAMCSTRMETGVGRPQLSAVLKTARAAQEVGKHVWADGGIQYPRDVALALAAGASQVMVGSLFASAYETPPEFQRDGQRHYKENYGMASRQASMLRNMHKLERDMRTIFREKVGHRSEGISGAKVFQREGMESVADMIHWIMDGVTSSMTYMGARTLGEFGRFAHIGVQTSSGYTEGTPKAAL